ncbi:MAG: ferritin [Victivallaceae bacterium]
MISDEMVHALNDQLNFELYSSYFYLSMTAALSSMNFSGAANWMNVQVQEELIHANRFFNYINARDARVELEAIKKPAVNWDSMLAVFEDAFKHEKIVSSRINNLAGLAIEAKDFSTYNMLQWFIAEQVEEESNVKKVIDRLKKAGDAEQALLMLDAELALRTLTPPPPDPLAP